jgi:hypothetical protein
MNCEVSTKKSFVAIVSGNDPPEKAQTMCLKIRAGIKPVEETVTTRPDIDIYRDACPEPALIAGYLLDDPEETKDPGLEFHLRICADCRLELEALKTAIGSLR